MARQAGRNYIGIEINPEYARMSRQRITEAKGGTPWQKHAIPIRDAAEIFKSDEGTT